MKKLILVFGLLLGLLGHVLAAGLSTGFGSVLISNLWIGETYSTKELINLPLRVKNSSPYEVDMRIEVMIPSEGDLKEGFEPLPDPTWIRFERSTFTVAPGGMAETDVFISIPKDKNLRGKQFQVYLHSFTVPKPGKTVIMSVGLASRLLFTIAERETARRKRGDEIGIFQVQPDNLFLIDVLVGEKAAVWEKFGKCLKIFNPNKVECKYEIRSISLKEADSSVRKGFEETPDPKFLTFDLAKVKVPPRSSKKVFLYLDIPDTPETREKNFMFLVRVKQLTGQVRIEVYSRLYVMTK